MAEELKLVIKVDKDGLVSVDELQRKLVRTNEAVEKNAGTWSSWMDGLKNASWVTNLNQGIELLGKVGAALGGIVDLMAEGERLGRQKSFLARMIETQGADAEKFLEQLRAVTNGAVSDKELREGANRFLQAGATVEATLAGISAAYRYTDRTGKAFNEGLEMAYGAIINKSVEASVKLGLVVDQTRALADYAEKTYGTRDAVRMLTDEQKRLAIQTATARAELAGLEKGFTGAGTGAEQAKKRIEDLKDSLKGLFGGGGTPQGLTPNMKEVLQQNTLAKQLEEYRANRDEYQRTLEALKAREYNRQNGERLGLGGVDYYEGDRVAVDSGANLQGAKSAKEYAAALETLTGKLKDNVVAVMATVAANRAQIEGVSLLERVTDAQGTATDLKVLSQNLAQLKAARADMVGIVPDETLRSIDREIGLAERTLADVARYQEVVKNASESAVQAAEYELTRLKLSGQGKSEEAKSLEALIPAMKEYLALCEKEGQVERDYLARGAKAVQDRTEGIYALAAAYSELSKKAPSSVDTLPQTGFGLPPGAMAAFEKWRKDRQAKASRGGRGDTDISEQELALRRQLASATNVLQRAQLEYALALQKLNEQKAHGQVRTRAYAASLAEEEARLRTATVAYTEAQAAKAQAEVLRARAERDAAAAARSREDDASKARAQEQTSLWLAEAEALDRLAVAQGNLTSEEFEDKLRQRQIDQAQGAEITSLIVDQEIADIERRKAAYREWGDVLYQSGAQIQGAMSWLQDVNGLNGVEAQWGKTAQYVAGQAQNVASSFGQLVGSIGGSSKDLARGAAASSSAVGQIFASFYGKDARAAAEFMAGWATATGMALLFLDPVQGANQIAAGAMYAVLALSAPDAKKGKGSIARSMGTSAPSAGNGGGNVSYNVYLSGKEVLIGASGEEVGLAIARTLSAAAPSGARLPRSMMQ